VKVFLKKMSIKRKAIKHAKIVIVLALNLFFAFKYEADATTPAMGKKNKNFFLSSKDETLSLLAFVIYIDSTISMITCS
tara:strand:+ start:139 stop:375 length:237 start_codon:yes stop_codon:yes gene_type:complete